MGMYDVIHEVYNSSVKKKEFNRKYAFTEYLEYVHFFRLTAHQKEDMIKMYVNSRFVKRKTSSYTLAYLRVFPPQFKHSFTESQNHIFAIRKDTNVFFKGQLHSFKQFYLLDNSKILPNPLCYFKNILVRLNIFSSLVIITYR